MDLEKEKEKIRRLIRCQRNWDYSIPIPKEHIEHFLWVAVNAPSKQWQAYYDVYYFKDRNVIKEFYKSTWGATHDRKPPSNWRNSQMNAGLYILFVAKHTVPMYNCYNDGSKAKQTDQHIWDNAYTHIGLALALVSKAAADLGYYTGYNKNNGHAPDYDYEWEKKMGIHKDVIEGKKKLTFGVGIGHPQKDRPRNQSDDYELAIGASNAHNMTFDKDGVRSKEKGKWRKCRIIDVRTANDIEIDPYGNKHEIHKTRKPEHKINSYQHRDIKCIEII